MNALVLALGSRGDLELFLHLAVALHQRGHHVHFVTSHFHSVRVTAAGIPCTPIGSTDPASLNAILASLASIPDLRARTRAYVDRFLRPQLALATPILESLAASSDYFVSNLKISVTRNGSVLPTAFVTYDPPAAPDELDRYSARLPRDRILELAAFPQTFIDSAATWPTRFRFTGFWLDPSPATQLPACLADFLSAGPPPVVLTTGSMRMFDPARLVTAFAAALDRTHLRGIVLGLPSTAQRVRPDICYADEVLYAALFPRVACVIHHGGVGTVAETLRAAKPSIILPQILAQRHIADLLQHHVLSPATLDPATLTAEELASAITAAVGDDRYAQSALAWRSIIARDGGVALAVTEIERHRSIIVPP